ncbi:Fe2+-dependent dioxygenase [Prochlorococcus marinus XMU1414]|uniref:Fe2+-dependent dioxygenase n=1 Tax=Prochlorococcus marinus XMU1424 TaxID=2774497 RepID=A0A9D9BW15_PROMR|nr:Fe2+-dependent dioxygenase [Prochlorococcus marinus]MBO8228618.1 Fe2+-dependent dioxygenase [Prochlorococcus marinus XMU1414]MBW3046096.1 Fe2+-dependent dioxygenase [Prochlorococcus marinus str. MU1414]MCR8531612.1 Fe2+-dependent dioxygenase [Prochlorococcus marinus XMU1420]MCR8535341.1 Fe2+-dependent dioxygenase [Prochlorococcus marinus XMU1424]
MNYLTHQLLNAEEINFIEKELELENQGWEDGKKTAGSHASIVKNNLQLKRTSDISKKLSLLIKQKILNNDLIKSFTLPKKIHGIMFTKSSKGMQYGRHIDNAYMSSGRADLSFTIFLSKKNLYEGGELLIENLTSENKFKLNSGEILIYPSTFLHSVQEVLNGERIVCVGWIESYIKSIEEREYLFDLDAGARSLLSKHGRSDDLDLIFKSYSNLLRVMGD